MCNGFQFRRECLKIKAFYIHLSSPEKPSSLFNDFLTLRFLPRMIHDPLEIDGSLIQSGRRSGAGGGPAFLTLHKLLSFDDSVPAVYGCRDQVKASEGVRFEIYNGGDAKILIGMIRKDGHGSWKLDCKRGDIDDDLLYGNKEAYLEVAIDMDGQTEVLNDTVKMLRRRRIPITNRRNYPQTRKGVISGLEEIPEDHEIESDGGSSSSSSSCCCCCDCDSLCGSTKQDDEEMEMEMEMENESSWAVDAAILVVGLGVGYLVSRASTNKLVRPWL